MLVAGYVPDTDSEAGTLTANSPTEWTEKQLNANLAATNPDTRQKTPASVKSKQSLIGRGDVCWDNSSRKMPVYFLSVYSLPVESCTRTNQSFTRMLRLSLCPLSCAETKGRKTSLYGMYCFRDNEKQVEVYCSFCPCQQFLLWGNLNLCCLTGTVGHCVHLSAHKEVFLAYRHDFTVMTYNMLMHVHCNPCPFLITHFLCRLRMFVLIKFSCV